MAPRVVDAEFEVVRGPRAPRPRPSPEALVEAVLFGVPAALLMLPALIYAAMSFFAD